MPAAYGLSDHSAHGHVLMGNRHMVSAGHFAAAHAGFLVLEGGGNAVDAGVAAGLALGVVQSDLVNVAGVAPIMIRSGETGEVVTIDGLGVWPARASSAYFREHHGGVIPLGLLRTVVPAAPAAWIAALGRWGTMSFGEVAAHAIRLAREGFPTHRTMAEFLSAKAADYARWPENARLYLPNGRPPGVGDLFIQSDLAASLQFMADEERAASARGRRAGLKAARDAFYRGDIARRIVRHHADNGGWLGRDDLASYDVTVEPPVRTAFGDVELYTCGPWCQGPTLGQILRILEGLDLSAEGHNSVSYIHLLTEAVKLAFADREAFYGDPRFVDVPLEALLSDAFAGERRKAIDPSRASAGMPAAGVVESRHPDRHGDRAVDAPVCTDTSYVAVVDRHGNAFSATPSDTSSDTEVIPATGLCPSSRGSQSWTVPGHPSELAPGKRPRLTPNPAIAILGGRSVMPFGTPGGDVQTQSMLQVLLNVAVFGMDLRTAVEAPRFASYSFPSSFEPHESFPGRLALESRIPAATADRLRAMGHDVQAWPDWTSQAGAVCALIHDRAANILVGAADPRRASYAVGW